MKLARSICAVAVLTACQPGSAAEHREAFPVPPSWPYHLDAPAVTAAHGMVATDAPLATHVGAEMLRHGGNAVDAAVATAFALSVVWPAAGNIGGGGFIVAQMADSAPVALDFREMAPAAATRDMFIGPNDKPDNRASTGDLAAGVPGSVAGLWEAHHRFGSRPWAEVLAPAIQLADSGFTVDSDFARTTIGDSARLSKFPASAALFLPNGHPLVPGTRWRNPELATVLRRIAKDGRAGFYAGPTAAAIVAEMKRGHGIMTLADLAAYRAKWRTPITFDYRGYHVISMPPPSSGGITLALMAHMLSGRDLRALGWHSPQEIHVLAESMRRAFAVRNHFLGDPDAIAIPTDRLMSQSFADSLDANIRPDGATPSADVSFPTGAGAEGKHTTHFSIVDGQGNAVALTTTINYGFGSASTVGGAGFLLNNEMDDFTAQPGVPNGAGLVQGEANAIAPGKRMLSSMTPTIVLGHDGKPMIVTGASGSGRIITLVFQVISNVVDYDMGIAAAVSAPRVHHQHLPDTLLYERSGLTDSTVAALRAMHYAVDSAWRGSLGIGASILRTPTGVSGMFDPRLHGAAEGY
ncbi:MAG TPA: gamma-glutamyltransferase [Gemmatimonadaceae bacterium]|nr:gamma-glutamyltransferase [Gemmatimonadaceae bacterium]